MSSLVDVDQTDIKTAASPVLQKLLKHNLFDGIF